MTPRDIAEYAGELFALAGAVILWFPAYRLSRNLLLVRRMDAVQTGPTTKLKSLARALGTEVKVEIQGFNLADYRCIYWGVFFTVVSSAIKLLLMITAPGAR